MIVRVSFMLILLMQSCKVYAFEGDDLKKTMDSAAAALRIQEERIKIASENIANEDTTSDNPNGNPYRRKIMIVKNEHDTRKKNHLLRVRKYDFDKSDFKLKYDPNHPAANVDGYVKYPNVNKDIEIGDIREAKSSHAANLAVIEMTKQMIKDTIDIMK